MNEDQDDLTRSNPSRPSGSDDRVFEKKLARETYVRNIERTNDLEDLDIDEYEEPDRDTDLTGGFREEAIPEDETFDDLLPEEFRADDDSLFSEQEEFLKSAAGTKFPEGGAPEPDSEDRSYEEIDQLIAQQNENEPPWTAVTNAEDEEEWSDDDDYYDDEGQSGLPLGLIAVGVVALLLVVAGVYGIVQQRSATEEQIRQLQSRLATAVTPEEAEAGRVALQETKARNAELNRQVDSLSLENQRLADTVDGLEAQVAALQQAGGDAAVPVESAAEQAAASGGPDTPSEPTEATAAAPAPKSQAQSTQAVKPAAAAGATTTGWFVNFGSYSSESVAKDWAERLRTPFGRVIVAPSSKDNEVFYRVRVVGLQDKQVAQSIARQLEQTYGLSRLWVGQQR